MVLIPTSLTFASETTTKEEQVEQDFVKEQLRLRVLYMGKSTLVK